MNFGKITSVGMIAKKYMFIIKGIHAGLRVAHKAYENLTINKLEYFASKWIWQTLGFFHVKILNIIKHKVKLMLCYFLR